MLAWRAACWESCSPHGRSTTRFALETDVKCPTQKDQRASENGMQTKSWPAACLALTGIMQVFGD